MLSPFPPSSSKAGHGEIYLTLLPPRTPSFSTLSYTYPLKLLPSTPHALPPLPDPELSTSKSRSSSAPNAQHQNDPAAKRDTPEATRPTQVPLIFLLTYGGGLLAGDTITVHISLDPGTRLAIPTQGSTKIYRPPSPAASSLPSTATPAPPTSRQDLVVTIGAGAALWLGPDPVQPFAGSLYAQTQIFKVERGGSLGMVDWVSEGRTSRGERWSFESWSGRNEVWSLSKEGAFVGEGSVKEERVLLVRDAVVLEGADVRARMDGMGVFGTMLLRGPLFSHLAEFFVQEFSAMPRIGGRNWSRGDTEGGEEQLTEVELWRKERVAREKEYGVLWTSCHVRGVCVVKFSAREVEGARWWLGNMVRKEGTVKEEFGDGGLMFVR